MAVGEVQLCLIELRFRRLDRRSVAGNIRVLDLDLPGSIRCRLLILRTLLN